LRIFSKGFRELVFFYAKLVQTVDVPTEATLGILGKPPLHPVDVTVSKGKAAMEVNPLDHANWISQEIVVSDVEDAVSLQRLPACQIAIHHRF
jgi:hypothetical protein